MDIISSPGKRFSWRRFIKQQLYGFITEYETPKIAMIHSFTITTLLRFMQTILLIYTVFYMLIYKKGYQKQDVSIISSVTLKVKGIGFVHKANNQSYVFDGTGMFI